MIKDTTPIVDAIGKIKRVGNRIDDCWYEHLKLPLRRGETEPKTDSVSVILLGDIFTWYEPTIKYDETTSEIISIKKKFSDNMLQKQYELWGRKFGYTKNQVKCAVDRLVNAGILKREFRNLTSKNGLKLNNIMYIELVPEKISEITNNHSVPATKDMALQSHTSLTAVEEVGDWSRGGTPPQYHTNTVITPYITPVEILSSKEDNRNVDDIPITLADIDLNDPAVKIFNHWNDSFRDVKGVTCHKSLTTRCFLTNKKTMPLLDIIKKQLKIYSIDDIIEGVANYRSILISDRYFYDIRSWTLGRFLTDKRGLDTFITKNDPFSKFKKNMPDEFDSIRKEFNPVTVRFERQKLLDKDRNTYFGFPTEDVKNDYMLNTYINHIFKAEKNGKFMYGNFVMVETAVAAFLFKRDKQALKKVFKLWVKYKDTFGDMAKKNIDIW